MHCQLGAELAGTSYLDRRGRRSGCGTFSPGAEVGKVRWQPLDTAGLWLSYDRDRLVLASLILP